MKRSNIKAKFSESVSIVAHQLKSPIAVMKAYLEVLLAEDFGPLNKKQKEYVEDLLKNIRRIIDTVADLLEVSKIEEKRYELKPEIFDLTELSKGVMSDFASLAKASNCRISFEAKEAPVNVIADPLKIRQVIENFISNAVKYKEAGPGDIRIGIQTKNDQAVFSCRDNGIGILKSDFKQVFSKFYRSEEAAEIDPTGIGLGLYISRAIIRLSGGEMWFTSKKGQETVFYFTLPLARQ